MIEANELRIGNWVKSETYNQIIELNLIDGYIKYDTINPIPLTEQWLLKFGFEPQDQFLNKVYSKFEGDEFNSSFTVLYDDLTNVVKISVTGFWYGIYTVHQLQNLYFALTGSELVLKPIVPEAI